MTIVGVQGANFTVFLPIGYLGLVVHPNLTGNVEVWKFICNGFGPAGHRFGVAIRIGVNPEAIQISIFNPPQGRLNKII